MYFVSESKDAVCPGINMLVGLLILCLNLIRWGPNIFVTTHNPSMCPRISGHYFLPATPEGNVRTSLRQITAPKMEEQGSHVKLLNS